MANYVNQATFYVYVSKNGNKFILEQLANLYNLTCKGIRTTFGSENYVQVNPEDIDYIVKSSKNSRKPLYKSLLDIKVNKVTQNNYALYSDQNNNLYISTAIASKYNITNKGKEILIKNEKYIQVNSEDINYITQSSNNTMIPLYKKCHLHEKKQNIVNHKYFIFYEDVENNKVFVNRDIYDLCKANGIDISGHPRIIENHNGYEISKEQLDEFMKKTGYIGKKQFIVFKNPPTMKINICEINGEVYIPAGLFLKHDTQNNRKILTVSGVKYISVNPADIRNMRHAYLKEGIQTELRAIKIDPHTVEELPVIEKPVEQPITEPVIEKPVEQPITEPVVEKPVEPPVKTPTIEEQREVLEKITALAEMLKRDDEVLKLPESIQK